MSELTNALKRAGTPLMNPVLDDDLRQALLAEIAEQLPAIIAALERAERLEKATREVAYEIERMEHLPEVPQIGQIAWWRDQLRTALESEAV